MILYEDPEFDDQNEVLFFPSNVNNWLIEFREYINFTVIQQVLPKDLNGEE